MNKKLCFYHTINHPQKAMNSPLKRVRKRFRVSVPFLQPLVVILLVLLVLLILVVLLIVLAAVLLVAVLCAVRTVVVLVLVVLIVVSHSHNLLLVFSYNSSMTQSLSSYSKIGRFLFSSLPSGQSKEQTDERDRDENRC